MLRNSPGFSLYQSVPQGFTTGLFSVPEATDAKVYITPTFVLEVPWEISKATYNLIHSLGNGSVPHSA